MMRGFSSSVHLALIASEHREHVNPGNIPRADLAILVAVVLACGVFLGGVAASLRGPELVPGQSSISPTASPRPTASLAAADVPGQEIDRLPRIPGSVRTAHEVIDENGFRLTANEYHVESTVDAVRAFYQGVIVDHGWERADISFESGEWSYILVDGGIEALIEIEELGGLVEVDLQISEPTALQTPTPMPAERVPPPAPTSAPVAPPPPPADDDDDDDDAADDDSDD